MPPLSQPRPLRVIKLGGSLLDYEGLPGAFRAWLARQSPAANVLIAGGGALVDVIRAADERHRFAPADSHKLAMACLSVTARMLSCLLPELPLLDDPRRFADWRDQVLNSAVTHDDAHRRTAIFDLGAAWRDDTWRRALGELPSDWNTTSDSLAAVVARRLEACELVLLKSADPPPHACPSELAALGFADPVFPRAVCGLPLRCVNLRSAEFAGGL